MTYYDILEILPTASPEIIKAAYHTMAKKYHPDIFTGTQDVADKNMKILNEAYSVLSNPYKRSEYDKYLSQKQSDGHSYQKEAENKSPKKETYGTKTTSKAREERTNPIYKINYTPLQYSSSNTTQSSTYKVKSVSETHVSTIASIVSIFVVIFIIATAFYYDTDSYDTPVSYNDIQHASPKISTVPSFSETKKAQETEPKLDPVPEPTNGYEFCNHTYKYSSYTSKLTVHASESASVVVMVKDWYDSVALCFYVQAGSTVIKDVPAQELEVFFASGKTWYGWDEKFGKSTSYTKDDEYVDFDGYTWEYTLYPVTDGNFNLSQSDSDEFGDI